MRSRTDKHAPKSRRWSRLLAVATAGIALTLGACNTMEGMGRDMQSAGQGLENEAQDAND